MLRCLLLWATMLALVGCTPDLAKITPAPFRVVKTPKQVTLAVTVARPVAMVSSVIIGPPGPSVTLITPTLIISWDASLDPEVAGYSLYYGIASRQYLSQLQAGTNLQVEIGGVTVGQTYYFAATCYGSAGIESDFSIEFPYTVPQQLGLFLEPVGSSLQSSPDLINWSPRNATLITNMWKVTIKTNTPQEFYRSIQ